MSRAAKRVTAVAATALIGSLTMAGAAAAAQVEAIDAPYAQAAGSINANGTIRQSKGVVQVTKPSTGTYCIELAFDTSVRDLVATATPISGAPWDTQVFATVWPTAACNNDENTLTILTGKATGGYQDAPFNFTVS